MIAAVETLSLRARTLVESVLTGTHRGRDRGFSVDFAEHRDYSPGDDTRFLDWKLYGRRDRFYVRQFEDENQLQAWVVLDDSGSMRFRSDGVPLSKLEYAVTLAAALIWIVCDQRDLAGFVTFESGRNVGPVFGQAGIQRVLNELETTCREQIVDASSEQQTWIGLMQAIQRIPHRSVVMLLTDAFGDLEQFQRVLTLLRKKDCDVRLAHVLDPAELTFPFEGNVIFRDLEGAGEQVTLTSAIRDGYLQEVEEFQMSLKRICGARQVVYQLVRTDSSVSDVLRALLSVRRR